MAHSFLESPARGISPNRFSLQWQPNGLPGGSSQLSLNHLALRRAPAQQNGTNDERDRTHDRKEGDEDRETMLKVQHGGQGNGSGHD